MKIRQYLKESIKEIHSFAEEQDWAVAMLSPGLDKKQYKNFLIAFYGFLKPQENFLKSEKFAFQLEAKKSNLLEQDLVHFGIAPSGIKLCKFFSDGKNDFDFIANCYLYLGQSLGASVIAKHIGETLNLDSNSGAAFFNYHENDTILDFFKYLDCTNLSNDELQYIAESANSSFYALNSWMVEHWNKEYYPS